jgi:hypothetical protein
MRLEQRGELALAHLEAVEVAPRRAASRVPAGTKPLAAQPSSSNSAMCASPPASRTSGSGAESSHCSSSGATSAVSISGQAAPRPACSYCIAIIAARSCTVR